MEKVKFVFFTVLGVGVVYLMLTAFMPVISSFSESSATEVQAVADDITQYVGAVEAVQYMPFILYLIPGVIGVGLIVWKLKFSKN